VIVRPTNLRERGLEMCDKRKELDDKIKHYLRIAASINDNLTIDRIRELVARLEAEKAALHPEQE
jgi:TorA maturation chaperone TorD